MPLRVACPHCSAACAIPDAARGAVVQCPRCQKPFRTTSRPSAVTAAAPKAAEPRPVRPPAVPAEAITAEPTKVSVPAARPEQAEPDESDEGRPEKPAGRREATKGNSRRRLLLGVSAAAVGLIAACACAAVGYHYFVKSEPAVVIDEDEVPSQEAEDDRDTMPLAEVPKPGDIAQGAPLVRPPANVLAIEPPPLKDGRATVVLPSPARDVCVGGGGRFLILLHLPRQRHLAVFDCCAARVVKWVPVPDDDVLFAAGMDKLLVVLPQRKLVQRWSLVTMRREATAPLVINGHLSAAVMGSASGGSLVLGGYDVRGGAFDVPLRFLDVDTLMEVEADRSGQDGRMVGTHPQYPAQVRASADGLTLGMWDGLGGRLQTVLLSGNALKLRYEHESVGHVLPGPDGRTLFTGSGLYDTSLHKLGGAKEERNVTLPAVHGNCYLSVSDPPPDPRGRGGLRATVTVHRPGDERRVLTLSDLDELAVSELAVSDADMPPFSRARMALNVLYAGLPLDKRLFLVPAAKLLVVVSFYGDRLYLYRCDPDGPLERAGGALVTPAEERKFIPLKLPPAAEPAPLQGEREELALPSPAGDVCVGGGGRFLILHLPGERKVAMFSTQEAKSVKYLPLPEDKVMLAAGYDALVILLPDKHILQRWSLPGLEREATVACPVPNPTGVRMDPASVGPLEVATDGAVTLLDLKTLKVIDRQPRPAPLFRRLLAAGEGTDKSFRRAVQGPCYLGFDFIHEPGDGAAPKSLSVYAPSDGRSPFLLRKMTDLDGVPPPMPRPAPPRNAPLPPPLPDLDGVPALIDDHQFLAPDAQLLVLLTAARDKLILHRVNFDDALARADFDYLFVTSQPPPRATKGQEYRYQLAVKSKKGGVQARLESGPAGLRLTSQGQLVWDVPADFPNREADVLLTIRDAGGREIVHSFTLAVGG